MSVWGWSNLSDNTDFQSCLKILTTCKQNKEKRNYKNAFFQRFYFIIWNVVWLRFWKEKGNFSRVLKVYCKFVCFFFVKDFIEVLTLLTKCNFSSWILFWSFFPSKHYRVWTKFGWFVCTVVGTDENSLKNSCNAETQYWCARVKSKISI